MALRYARAKLTSGKIIAWGSSYSASLVLKIIGEQPELADGVVAFSPGEYFTAQGKPKDWIAQSSKRLNIPTFITSAHGEQQSWAAIFKVIPAASKTSYTPKGKGQHGSRSLWDRFSDSDGYWQAVGSFLKAHFGS